MGDYLRTETYTSLILPTSIMTGNSLSPSCVRRALSTWRSCFVPQTTPSCRYPGLQAPADGLPASRIFLGISGFSGMGSHGESEVRARDAMGFCRTASDLATSSLPSSPGAEGGTSGDAERGEPVRQGADIASLLDLWRAIHRVPLRSFRRDCWRPPVRDLSQGMPNGRACRRPGSGWRSRRMFSWSWRHPSNRWLIGRMLLVTLALLGRGVLGERPGSFPSVFVNGNVCVGNSPGPSWGKGKRPFAGAQSVVLFGYKSIET